ncbi:MAG: hypothetical protein RIR39_1390, partial [Pseudomonadota bacterium]
TSNIASDAMFDFNFTYEHSAKLIRISENKELINLVSGGDILTINEMSEIVANKTAEQEEELKILRLEEEDRIFRKASEDAYNKQVAADKATAGIIEGEFVEVTPEPVAEIPEAPKPEAVVKKSEVDLIEEKLEMVLDQNFELTSMNNALDKDNESLVKIFESDEQLKTSVAEVRRLNEMVTLLNGRIVGLQNECNEAKKNVRMWKSLAEKSEKALKKAGELNV